MKEHQLQITKRKNSTDLIFIFSLNIASKSFNKSSSGIVRIKPLISINNMNFNSMTQLPKPETKGQY